VQRVTWSKAALRLATLLLTLLLATSAPAAAQRATLTLDEAIALARSNNPDYQAQRTDVVVSDWNVRAAYAALLPGATASTGFQYQGSGSQRIGSFTGGDLGLSSTPSYLLSNYSLGFNYQLSGASVLAPRRERANRRAVEASIDAAGFNLDAQVTRQYLAFARALDAVQLARQELERAEDTRRLADARVQVGSAIPLEVMQADVQRGRAEVALLQAENETQTSQLRLIQVLGIELDREIVPTSDFEILPLQWTLDELVATATGAHPQIMAARAAQDAADQGVRIARSAYLPTVDVSTGVTGYTRQSTNNDFLVEQARVRIADQQSQCQLLNQISSGLTQPLPGTPVNCSQFTMTPDQEAQIRAGNSAFPFNFTREPIGASLRISLPLFQGLNRERQVEAARVAAQDARYRIRGEELRIRTEVSTAYLNATTAQRSVALEARNAELAEQQLRLARERYRLGASSFIEMQEAETAKARADRAQLTAIYNYHEALAALEAAVGRPLRENR
jgi:outer membrane protein